MGQTKLSQRRQTQNTYCMIPFMEVQKQAKLIYVVTSQSGYPLGRHLTVRGHEGSCFLIWVLVTWTTLMIGILLYVLHMLYHQ